MPLLTTQQVELVYKVGACGRTALYALKNVDAADTVDLSAQFSAVKRAGIVSDTGTTIAVAAVSGTPPITITIPAGPADDGVWLLAVGVAN